ncbi:MAG: hypothetical protein AMXMBFR82_33190 [Candidatus Hydrogenedentota bacterium]
MVEPPKIVVISGHAPAAAWAREVLSGTGLLEHPDEASPLRLRGGVILEFAADSGYPDSYSNNAALVRIVDPAESNGDACPDPRICNVPAGDPTAFATAVQLCSELLASRMRLRDVECALAYRVQFETLLTELSSRLVHTSSIDLSEVIAEAVTMIGIFTNVDRCYLFQFDEEGSIATFTHEWCAAGIESHLTLFSRVDLAAFPWTHEMYLRMKYVYIPRIEDLPDSAKEERAIYQTTGIRSVLAVPLAVNRRLLGILGLATQRAERTWMEEDIRMLEALAQLIANALERKRNDAALSRVEGRFREIADLLPIAIGIHADSRFVYANQAAESISGYTREEVLLRDVFSFLHPGDTDTVREHLDALAQTGAEKSHEVRFFNKHGEERWAELQSRMIEFDGKPSYLLAAVDTTDRKRTESALRESEERLRSLLENMPVMMDAFDAEGTIIVWNRECERVTGYRSEEIVGNPRAIEMLYPDAANRERMFEEFDRLGSDFRDWEIQLTCKDGTLRTISWASISGLFPISGWAYWAVGMDVTERKLLEKQVLEISAREQIRIGQDLHDRLGQLLTGLGFKAQSLADRLGERGVGEAEAAERLVGLVSESIALTRSLSKGLQPVEVGADGLMTALEELALQARDLYGVHAEFLCEEPVLVEDNSMATHLYRIAQEAVNNAAKHGTPGSIEIRLTSDDGSLSLSVEDDGIGLDPSEQPNGGLGMNIMAYRASVIDGKLELRPRPGGGTMVLCNVRLTAPTGTAHSQPQRGELG